MEDIRMTEGSYLKKKKKAERFFNFVKKPHSFEMMDWIDKIVNFEDVRDIGIEE